MAGHTQVGFTALPPAIASIQDGKVRGLAIMAAKRNAGLPDLPTMAEAGVPDQESDTVTGIVMRAGTPPVFDRALASRDRAHRRAARGQRAAAQARLRPDRQFAGRVRGADQERRLKWDKVAKEANIRIN